MEVKTYRAATMYEALALVRRDLGPEAAVLHTREVRNHRLFGLVPGRCQIEVTASAEVNVPSRFPPPDRDHRCPPPAGSPFQQGPAARVPQPLPEARPENNLGVSAEMQRQLSDLQTKVEQLCQRSPRTAVGDLPEELFRLFTDLLDADLSEELARDLLERVRRQTPDAELADPVLAKARIARMIEAEISIAGPIKITPGRRLVALVGPTGVGKTTTIAKLAANYRLKEQRRIGLITVDTYRIAAVEQLRTYAEIIDLPMQVVSTPDEIGEALRRMEDVDLVLMDTAGRSPRDEVKIQQLSAFLTAADADEVHLVLSSVSGSRALEQTAGRFAAVGTTALVLTKLDEAAGLGNALPLLRSSRLPLSYLTNGQNVPDDIETADARRVARLILSEEN